MKALFTTPILCLAVSLAPAAHATVGCTVTSSAKGITQVALYDGPASTAKILREVPTDDIVFRPDDDLAPTKAEGWTWVRHDATQDSIWDSGIFGWMKDTSLTLCG